MGNYGMTAGFGKLSTKKHQQFKKPPNKHKNAKYSEFVIYFNFFLRSNPVDSQLRQGIPYIL